MRAFTIAAFATLDCYITFATLLERHTLQGDPTRHHARQLTAWNESKALLSRDDDPHDRGTWNFDCTNAPMACNNACYSINCLAQGTQKMFFDPENNNDVNRVQSGCEAPNSICKAMPFSQTLNDPQKLTGSSCDEWPMAVSAYTCQTFLNILLTSDIPPRRPSWVVMGPQGEPPIHCDV